MGVCVDESISTGEASPSSGGCNLGGFGASSSKEFVMSLVRGMCHDIKGYAVEVGKEKRKR